MVLVVEVTGEFVAGAVSTNLAVAFTVVAEVVAGREVFGDTVEAVGGTWVIPGRILFVEAMVNVMAALLSRVEASLGVDKATVTLSPEVLDLASEVRVGSDSSLVLGTEEIVEETTVIVVAAVDTSSSR